MPSAGLQGYQAIVSYPLWVLGTELGFSGRASVCGVRGVPPASTFVSICAWIDTMVKILQPYTVNLTKAGTE